MGLAETTPANSTPNIKLFMFYFHFMLQFLFRSVTSLGNSVQLDKGNKAACLLSQFCLLNIRCSFTQLILYIGMGGKIIYKCWALLDYFESVLICYNLFAAYHWTPFLGLIKI